MNSELACADGADTTTKMVRTDDGEHIPAIFGEFVVDFSNEPETLVPHRSFDHAIDLEPSYNLPYGQMYNISELGGAILTQLCGLRSHADDAGSWIWT